MADERETVLITGCNPGGIGHALALEFHEKGYRVLATARQTSSIADLAALGIHTLPLELTSPSSIAALHTQLTQLTGGKLHYLINNAGRNYTVPALDIDLDDVQAMFAVNLFGVMRMCQTFAPALIAAGAPSGKSGGTIVQIGSLAGEIPYVFGAAYNASKAALRSYSDALRVELAPFGVSVITVVTGGVRSNLQRVERELRPESLYGPIAAEYRRRLKHATEGAMETRAYARSVVAQVTARRKPRWVWEGNKSWLVRFALRFLPHGLFDYVMTRMFNLWKLKGTAGKMGKTD